MYQSSLKLRRDRFRNGVSEYGGIGVTSYAFTSTPRYLDTSIRMHYVWLLYSLKTVALDDRKITQILA